MTEIRQCSMWTVTSQAIIICFRRRGIQSVRHPVRPEVTGDVSDHLAGNDTSSRAERCHGCRMQQFRLTLM